MALHAVPSCPEKCNKAITLLRRFESLGRSSTCESTCREQSDGWLGSAARHVIFFPPRLFHSLCSFAPRHSHNSTMCWNKRFIQRDVIMLCLAARLWTGCSYQTVRLLTCENAIFNQLVCNYSLASNLPCSFIHLHYRMLTTPTASGHRLDASSFSQNMCLKFYSTCMQKG